MQVGQSPVSSRILPRQKGSPLYKTSGLSGHKLEGKTSMFVRPMPCTARPRMAAFFDVAQDGFKMDRLVMLLTLASSMTASSVSGCSVRSGDACGSQTAHGSIYTD